MCASHFLIMAGLSNIAWSLLHTADSLDWLGMMSQHVTVGERGWGGRGICLMLFSRLWILGFQFNSIDDASKSALKWILNIFILSPSFAQLKSFTYIVFWASYPHSNLISCFELPIHIPTDFGLFDFKSDTKANASTSLNAAINDSLDFHMSVVSSAYWSIKSALT